MNKRIFLFCALFLIFLSANTRILKAQTSGEPYVILVEFALDGARVDEAIELLSDIQLQTLENEEGCLVYDVLLSEEDPAKVFIYESYESEDAYKVHSNAPYFKEIVLKKLKPLIKSQKITRVFPLNFEGESGDTEI
ncbi:MAG TPA: antibiotic biosynthesis monooxygenase [Petrimonas sp.]|uniref:putative quinol monooxygenase n=1 Tax=Petrimonas sp. TaxID=2023866 RepID=UPI00175B5A6E|nr:putative quinol monooxygenase [Petrimonas sp.]MEA4950401.1 putative quinol monooxygenase [Petrimonas sp.]MEA4980719.1 putative quinol monooxygenase [Petrimonas sp.]MEA5046204.1 putative quinol monooxygenase [Petrimonas sp.]MEA5064214.1 putative quinol monooxygenase [Petrimonas sp.]